MSSAHSESAPPHVSDDAPSSGTISNRGRRRGISKRPTGRFTITEVDQSGTPINPRRAASAFRRMVGIVARERVKITYDSWKVVPGPLKTAVLTEILASFEIPVELLDSVRRHALLQACKAWKNFKSTLVKNYVEKDLKPPFHKYLFLEESWAEFVAKKTTDEFKSESAAHTALQAKNKHPHRLGTAGYAGKAPIWRDQEQQASSLNLSLLFPEITDVRARQWLFARLAIRPTGEVYFPNPEDQEVSQRLVRYRTT